MKENGLVRTLTKRKLASNKIEEVPNFPSPYLQDTKKKNKKKSALIKKMFVGGEGEYVPLKTRTQIQTIRKLLG